MATKDDFTAATHTRAIVEFHSDQHLGGTPIVLGVEESPFGRLVSLHTDKSFSGLSGSWTCVVKKPPLAKRQNSLLRVWRDPEDVWVRIYIVKNGKRHHVMTGLVDSIRESTIRSAEGKRVETYTIAGRDTGKVFETTEVWVNQYDFGGNAVAGISAFLHAFADHPGLVNATPAVWVRTLIESFVGNHGIAEAQWILPSSLGGGSFFNALSLDNLQSMDEGNGKFSDLGFFNKYDDNHGIGNLAEALENYSNDFLNELWIDLSDTGAKNEKAAVYLRERPFITFTSGRERWESIRSHTLEKRDVQSRELAKGGTANRFNYWSIRIDGNVATMNERSTSQLGRIDDAKQGQPGAIPIWNRDSISKHGVRKWEKGTLFLNGFIEGNDVAKLYPSMACNWLRKAHDWYCVAPWQASGTIGTTQVRPEIRLGNKLVERRDEGDMEFYVEGVSHDWRYPGAAHTMLTVTRGQYIGEDLIGAYRAEMNEGSILPDCKPGALAHSDVIQDILDTCKFVPDPGSDSSLVTLEHGGIGFDIERPDSTYLELPGMSITAFSGKPPTTNPDRKMIPDPDVESAQAAEIAGGNPSARVRRASGVPFGKTALKRREDPLKGYDGSDPLNDDPIGGLFD